MIRTLVCYRLDYRSSLDEELVWELVQRHGGYISIGPVSVDFWIDPQYATLMALAFPQLVPRPNQDYV